MSHADDFARTTNLLGSLSLAVADRLRAATEVAAGHAGSGPAALAALSTYLEGEPIDALWRSLGLTQSAAVRLVDRLEESGLVERGRGVDGRSVSVVMTAAGRRTGRGILDARQRALGEVLESLTPSERRTLAGVCEKLLGGLTESRADARRICRLCDPDACGHYDGRCPVTRAADQAGEHPDARRGVPEPPARGPLPGSVSRRQGREDP
jgi:MarR family transcriptional regulator, negative regulator of the multidrug operon emrRAB